MPLVPLITVLGGAGIMIALLFFAFAGPSAQKAQARRLTSLKERHSGATSEAAMAAQMRRITGKRDSNMDSWMMRLLPRPALLKKRLAMTGKTWTVGQYGMASAGLIVVVGGLIGDLLISIFLLPTFYVWWARPSDHLPHAEEARSVNE